MADRRRRFDARGTSSQPSSGDGNSKAPGTTERRTRVPGAAHGPASHTPSPETRRSASRERDQRREALSEERQRQLEHRREDVQKHAAYSREPFSPYGRGGVQGSGPREVVAGHGGTSEEDFFTRPDKYKSVKTGSTTEGIHVDLQSNYVAMKGNWDTFVVLYDVQFVPDELNRTLRRQFLNKLMENKGVPPVSFVYNGRNLMYLRGVDAGKIREASDSFARDGAPNGVKCVVKQTRVIGKQDTEILSFLNNVKNRWIEGDIRLSMLGRAHYDPTRAIKIAEGPIRVTLWPGFSTAIGFHDQGVLLNIDNRFKVIREMSVLQCIQEVFRFGHGSQEQKRSECMDAIVGSIVITQYSDKPRTYRVLDIDWNAQPSKTFDIRGNQTSLASYYQTKYGIQIRDPHQPLLLAEESGAARFKVPGQQRQTYLIPELCNPTGLTDAMRENFRLMKQMGDYTLQAPDLRRNKLYDFMDQLLGHANVKTFMQSWKLGFEDDLISVPGRILKPAPLTQGPKKITYDIKTADWTKDIRSGRFHLPFDNPQHVIFAFPQQFHRGAEEFWRALREVGGPLGFNFPDPETYPYANDREVVGQLRIMCRSRNVSLIIVILKTKTKGRYDDIKQLLCREIPVISQCVVQKTLEKQAQLKSVATKIAIQMGAKIGGAPWSLDFSRFGKLPKRIMFVGVDTYHDSGSKGGSRSAVAVVGTLDSSSTQYSHRIFFQSGRQEIGDQLGFAVGELMNDYKTADKDGQYPAMVIFYRDGVGVGQLPIVLQNEVESIRRTINSKDQRTLLVFTVVTKRHNTRFLQKDSKTVVNPGPGTVVDTVVTKPNRMDFYIVAQTVRQGTVAPTYYNVLFDNSDLNIDQLQQLTYAQCCMYFNWSGTVKVPAQCQYAHKLAFLVGQSIHEVPNEHLRQLLFFL